MIDSILRLSKLLAIVALAGLIACGDDDDDNNDNGGGDNRVVTVTGNAAIFPPAAAVLAQAGGGTYDPGDVSNLEVTLASALAELTPNNQTFLGDSPQNLVDAAGNNATFSVPNVDVDDVGIAIIAHLEPEAGATEPVQTHRVTTGILSVGDIPTGDLTGPLDTSENGAPAFILPAAFESILATATGNDIDTMTTDGYLLVFVTNGQAGISGATVTLENVAGTDVTADYDITYPTFTGLPGASTGSSGIAVVLGPETTAPLTIIATAGANVYGAQGGIKPETTFIAPATPQQ